MQQQFVTINKSLIVTNLILCEFKLLKDKRLSYLQISFELKGRKKSLRNRNERIKKFERLYESQIDMFKKVALYINKAFQISQDLLENNGE